LGNQIEGVKLFAAKYSNLNFRASMLSRKPFFSVLMPTYNRAHLLPYAIKSVLQQSFEDFELIVCNGGSTDNTREVVKNFDDSRLHYVEAREKLSIGDNYLLALSHSTGEYITFLGDDDAFVPTMFEEVKKIINEKQAQIVGFRFANYYHDDYVESFYHRIGANTLQIQPFTNEVTEFTATEAINNLYQFHGLNSLEKNNKFIIPYLANAVYHHNIFEKIKTFKDNPFAATPADMYLAAAVFFVIDSYFCLDTPLHVWSRWSGSSTAMAGEKGNAFRKHYEKLLGGEKLEFTPIKFALPHNCAVNAIIQASNDCATTDVEIDWFRYYVTVYENLLYLRSMKIDVSHEFSELYDSLARESPELIKQVESEINKPILKTKLFLRDNLPSALKIGRKIFKCTDSDKPIEVNGDQHQFTNVLQAAQFLAARFLKKQFK